MEEDVADREAFQAAYRAYRDKRKQYDELLEAVITGGEPLDRERLQSALAELNLLHQEFMEKSKPFVYWR